MRAAVQDVHHRRRQQAGSEAAEVLIERDAEVVGHGARRGHRDRQDRVGAQLALGRRAVEREHGVVELALVAGVHAFQLGGDHFVDVVDGLQHAFADVAALVAIAQLQRFVLAGGGAAGHGGAAARSAFQNDIGFDGGIAARIQNFAAKNQFNLCHASPALLALGFAERDGRACKTSYYTGA